MNIKKITIKNIRGLQNHVVQLDMIPNKPSILVAPNGTGKSSFAIAFQSITKNGLKLDEDEYYCGNKALVPSVDIETDDGVVSSATPNMNTIKDRFAFFVINSQNRPKTLSKNIDGVPVYQTKMAVEPIVLVSSVPSKVPIENTFVNDYNLGAFVRGVIPSINDLISSNKFWDDFCTEDLKNIKLKERKIDAFIDRLRTYQGTKMSIWNKIEQEDLPILSGIDILNSRVQVLSQKYPEVSEAALYLRAIQIVKLYKKETGRVKQLIKYANYQAVKNGYIDLFKSLKTTWKDIKPKETGGKLIVEIPDTRRLSNGERDIIVFLAMLQKARMVLNKEHNILIIDELFDYLDDANLVAAQYYITLFINELKGKNKNIYPIILSHINPDYYKTYAFKANKMKVYYLAPHPVPRTSEKTLKLLRKRGNNVQDVNYQKISKYMLHYHNDYDAGEHEMAGILTEEEWNQWSKVRPFKDYCKREAEKYVNQDGAGFDAIAVCVWLRECIESYAYNQLPVASRWGFIEEHGTGKKLDYAEEHGVECPEIFSLLSMIYNDSLHVNGNQEKDLRQMLYSRLENNTIRSMVQKTMEYYQ